MELGLTSFAETHPNPATGKPVSHGERLRNVIDVMVQDEWWIDRDSLRARLPG